MVIVILFDLHLVIGVSRHLGLGSRWVTPKVFSGSKLRLLVKRAVDIVLAEVNEEVLHGKDRPPTALDFLIGRCSTRRC